MIKIGITGSLASGKSTASKFLSDKRGPLFSADNAVKELYKISSFKSLISKKFKISRERIRQIENKAFEKLQKHMLNSAKSKNLISAN